VGGAIVREDFITTLGGARLHPTGGAQPPLHRGLERVDEERAKEAGLQRPLTRPAPCPGPIDPGLYRLDVKRIDRGEVIEALGDAPAGAASGTPVELFIRARGGEVLRHPVGVVHIVENALKVGR